MKRNAVRIMTLLLAVVFAFCGCASSPEKTVYELSRYTENNDLLGGMLRVENGVLVDESGNEIVLHGVNLGNWLLIETWMSWIENYSDEWGYYDTIEVLSERFGAEKTAELINTYENNFIRDTDIEQIEKLGFNCVRVPFGTGIL